MLPVELPETDTSRRARSTPTTSSPTPRARSTGSTDWVDVELDLGDGPQRYRRDTNVMPQWAGSCWYEMRYLDPTNENAFVDPDVERYWMGPRTAVRPDHPGGVDLYVGGVEHAVLHLLYARFWHKVLFDLGHVSARRAVPPPVQPGLHPGRRVQGRPRALRRGGRGRRARRDGFTFDGEPVSREWGKMGKSLKNAVSPDEMYDQYGADTLRLYEMSMGPLDASRPWETPRRRRHVPLPAAVWRNLVDEETGELQRRRRASRRRHPRLLHRTIDGVRADMEALRFNTAIAKLIELNNHVTKLGATPRVGRPSRWC